MRLIMSLLARDEADIVGWSIRYHSRRGVDAFIVTDNGSKDGTRELLADLSRHVEMIVLDEPEHTIAQHVWVTRMAALARHRLGADWFIASDADEFWIPLSGDLRHGLDDAPAVLDCPRVNMLPARGFLHAPGTPFYDSVLQVARPFDPEPYRRSWQDGTGEPAYPSLMARVGSKVMCRPGAGIGSFTMGNHDVTARDVPRARAAQVLIEHFPVRSFPQFEGKVVNYGESLLNNPAHGPMVSWHLRRWHRAHLEGRLRREYERFFLDPRVESSYLAQGILRRDDTIRRALAGEPGLQPAA
jgi:hypothetical protein